MIAIRTPDIVSKHNLILILLSTLSLIPKLFLHSYGFLGASGCGKTTVLSIIVGQLKLDGGSMSVFGGLPGDGKIGIPGKNVGYMPQVL